MIGKKKTKHVQFYMEVMEASLALGQVRKSRFGDTEEIEDEQRERELKNKLNKDFQNFVKKVEEFYPDLEFDIPYRELGFWGVPYRDNVFLTPTVHCLINVIEYPWFVMPLEDIQIAYFERIAFSLRNFDLVFVFNDWNEKPVQINSIPIESLDTIRDWLDSCNIKYYSGKTNLNWRKLLDQIAADPKRFWDEGGWKIFDDQGAEDDDDDEPRPQPPPSGKGGKGKRGKGKSRDDEEEVVYRGEDDYRPSGSEESEDYMDEESLSAEAAAPEMMDDDEDDEVPPPQEDEEGVDWDDLEKNLEKEDKKAALKRKSEGSGYDSDTELRARPKPAGAVRGAPGAPGATGAGLPPRKKPRI